jgi:benzoyl-CoA reductase/2-hydroxyglutaryl-CoA dehydratase subunit BcrC/BadD/HgdB
MTLQYLQKIKEMRDQTLISLAHAKEREQRVIGYYCAFSPIELALAVDAIAVPLCGSKQEPYQKAGNDLPHNLCPVVLSSYELAMTDSCPFFHFSEFVIAETTCDGKKKVYEMLRRIKPLHIMNLPQNPDLPNSLVMMESEVLRLKTAIEEFSGKCITDSILWDAIRLVNRETCVRRRFFDLNRAKPALITSRELFSLTSDISFTADRQLSIQLLEALITEIEARSLHEPGLISSDTPRILLTGTPVNGDREKIMELVEECGGMIVAMENCGGYKTAIQEIDESDSRSPVTLLADKYLGIPCSVMSPNQRRLDLIKTMVFDFKIDGIIDLTWQACHTYNIEAYWINQLAEQLGQPYLHVETGFSDADRENLRIRIEAFIEIIKE